VSTAEWPAWYAADSSCTALFHQYLFAPVITSTWNNGDPCDGAHIGITCAPFLYPGDHIQFCYKHVSAMNGLHQCFVVAPRLPHQQPVNTIQIFFCNSLVLPVFSQLQDLHRSVLMLLTCFM